MIPRFRFHGNHDSGTLQNHQYSYRNTIGFRGAGSEIHVFVESQWKSWQPTLHLWNLSIPIGILLILSAPKSRLPWNCWTFSWKCRSRGPQNHQYSYRNTIGLRGRGRVGAILRKFHKDLDFGARASKNLGIPIGILMVLGCPEIVNSKKIHENDTSGAHSSQTYSLPIGILMISGRSMFTFSCHFHEIPQKSRSRSPRP